MRELSHGALGQAEESVELRQLLAKLEGCFLCGFVQLSQTKSS